MLQSFRRSVRWDRPAASYQFCEQVGNTIRTSDLDFQSHIWQEWLEQVSSFAFESKDGHHFTARKETRIRGDAYWIAYREVDGKLTHKYLGRPVDVTPARLEEVAAALAGREKRAEHPRAKTDQQEHMVQSQFVDQLLSTKFFIPVSSHVLVSRPRLFGLLDEGLRRSLTLISAPAGFGKTTLLSSWVQALPENAVPVAWVSLDEQNNDPVHFWNYVLTALNRQYPGRFMSLLTTLQAQREAVIPYFAKALINQLVQEEEPCLLLLDDYHVITQQVIHSSLASLVECRLPHVHLILATRSDPPFPLARLRGRGQVLEIDAEQLRCTPEETGLFLDVVMGIALAEPEVREVTTRTEGWLVGLQYKPPNHCCPIALARANERCSTCSRKAARTRRLPMS